MTPDPNERDLRLAEYVLGTLPLPERAAVELELAVDPVARAARDAWERRLAPLALTAPEVQPVPDVWPAIARSISTERAGGPVALPPRAANDDRIGALHRSLRRWRLAAGTAAALAAGLALFIGVGAPRTVGEDGRYLAVVNSGGEAPALLVSIDTRAGTARVRPVGAQTPPGHSLELWYVGDGEAPKTLGLVGSAAQGLSLPADARSLAAGTFAVSVEPKGGSPTGKPTGPVVYSGKLIRE